MNNTEIKRLLINIFSNNENETLIINGLNDKYITYRDFIITVSKYKNKLIKFGVKPRDKVCVVIDNSLHLIYLYFACLLLECTIIPIDPHKGKDQMEYILSLFDKKLLISDHEFERGRNNILIKEFSDCNENIESNNYHNFIKELDFLDFDKPFLITFTSGTTGVPKGVIHSFRNLVYSAKAFQKKFGFNKTNIFYHNLPMTYMAGILNLIILPLISESKILIGERFSIANAFKFWEKPLKYSVNTFWFTPTILSILMKVDRENIGLKLSENQKVIGCVGTSPLNNKLKKSFEEKYNIDLYESYGLSETLFISTNHPNGANLDNSVGEILDEVVMEFDKDDELLLSVPWQFLGYLNVNTDEFISGAKYKTGDIGKLKSNNLYITGRKKDLIIKGGMNISPVAIEIIINEFNVFEEFVVLGVENNILGEKITCVYIPNRNFDIKTKKEINLSIMEKLGKDCCVDEFIEFEEIPKNINGKIDKNAIKKML